MKLDISRVFSDTMRSISERFGSLLGIWAVFFGILIATGIVFSIAMAGAFAGLAAMAGGMQPGAGALAGLGGGAILGILAFYLVLFYINSSSNSALTSMASLLHRPDMGKAIGDGFRSGLSVLGAMLLVAVPLIIVFFVVSMIGAALGEGAGVLVMLLLAIAIVYVSIRFAVVVPVIAVEGERNPITALTRTWSLTNGNALQIFLVYLVVGVAMIVLFLILGIALGGMFTGMMAGATPPGAGTLVFVFLLYIVLIAGLTIFSTSLSAALHGQLAGASGTGLEDTFG